MKKIRDITTNTTPYGESYNRDNVLAGRILVNDDNTFEGLLVRYDEGFLVTGTMNEEKIELILNKDSYDKVYKVERDGKVYYGDCFIKENGFEHPIESCMIKIMKPEEYRTLFPGEEKTLEKEIQKVKTTKK